MTKGKALIEARKILGDNAHVRHEARLPYPCKIGTFGFQDGWQGVAVGRTWEEALKDARRARL